MSAEASKSTAPVKWMGVDVGGRRKGFDVAVIDSVRLLEIRRRQSVGAVVQLVKEAQPAIVAIDSPRSTALPGATLRPEEKRLAREVCGIRWTPPPEKLHGNPYYEWIVEGLRLYRALADERAQVVECFPTASWTRWYGPRAGRPRSRWSRAALAAQPLADVPDRIGQDARDAIAAALTGRDHSRGDCECFGDIVVPLMAHM